MTSRGALRTHPMNIDGSVVSFASFHNVNCPKGFLYFNKKVMREKKFTAGGDVLKLSVYLIVTINNFWNLALQNDVNI